MKKISTDASSIAPAPTMAPDQLTALYGKALACHRQGDLASAVICYRSVLSGEPAFAPAHLNLGVALFQCSDYAGALACFQLALRYAPHLAQAHFNGGNALRLLGRVKEAEDWYARAVEIDPTHADALYNLGNLSKSFGRIETAIGYFRKAVFHQPDYDMAWNNLGTALFELKRTEEARDCFSEARRLNCDNIEALYNFALSCKRQGKAEEALNCVEQVLSCRPDHGPALALWVPLLQQNCEWKKLGPASERLENATRSRLAQGVQPFESPFLSFSRSCDPQRNFEVAKAWSRALSLRLAPERRHLAGIGQRSPRQDRITIAYLSEQFRDAATAHLTAGLFERHDRGKFNVIAYSLGKNDGGVFRRRIEKGVDRFIDIRNESTLDTVLRMRADRVDILVDLIGWMHGHRMGILALRAAPIQVNYLGFPGTSGADFIDYIVADATVVAPEHQQYFSEKVVCLPHCYQATDPDPPVFAGRMTRAACGLPEKGIVFASFNTDYKIDAEVFALWMKILHAVPGSVLWLLVRTASAIQNLRKEAQAANIDPERLVFADPWPKDRHLARLRLADVALDTLTVNGHTTTTDALWSGVPVVTRQGCHFASRVAASILKAVGLPELITYCSDDYLHLIRRLALEPGYLPAIKNRLHERKGICPLFDIHRSVGHLESAYLSMWKQYTDGVSK